MADQGARGTQSAGPNPAVVAGNLGYWAFDNAVLWATFHAVGAAPAHPVSVAGSAPRCSHGRPEANDGGNGPDPVHDEGADEAAVDAADPAEQWKGTAKLADQVVAAASAAGSSVRHAGWWVRHPGWWVPSTPMHPGGPPWPAGRPCHHP